MLLPPDNFGVVEQGIYSCSKLDVINFAFLETLQLKSIIILNSESQLMKSFQKFMKMNSIKSIKFEDESINTEIGDNNTDWMVFPTEVIQNVLKVLLNKNSYNLLIIDKTNVIIGLLRKICKWNYSSIISEYRLFSGKNSNYFAETFLELATIQLKPNDSLGNRRESIDLPNTSLHSDRVGAPDVDMQLDPELDNDNEDAILSASPQVPQSLLKMVELRKKKNDRSESTSSYTRQYQNLGYKDYAFYKPEQVFNVDVINVSLPAEGDLPDWFKLQRDMWMEELEADATSASQ